jgi:hypothetical protein
METGSPVAGSDVDRAARPPPGVGRGDGRRDHVVD